ncbi:hypothetical protein [Clostridium sp. CF012]|uniref:hypothetical protein n=1 Tax=Clostridium sp. CF012 TaxID=2843319 RepID=UPI001C0CE0E2|nr:hypothetical protein [Clostridium sp. CF012]MBU3144301.1 hypothetical protein [Clostridium sp. CF012]
MEFFNGIVRFIYKGIVYPPKFILFKIIYFIEKKLISKNLSDICEKCYEKVTLPYYVCPSCNNRYAALMPAFKHIFYFKCICGNKLPLTVLSGKNKLKTLCRKCKNEAKMNKVKKICIPIIGTNSSIKENFIYNMLDTIEWKFQKPPFKAYVSTPKTQKFFLGKNKKKPSRQIYIFDTNASDLVLSDNLKKYGYFNYYDGIVFIINGEEFISLDIEVENNLTSNDILDIFILNLHKNFGIKPGEIINKPIAFIINKSISISRPGYIEEKFKFKIENNFSDYRIFLIDDSNLTRRSENKASFDEAEVFQWILGEVDNKIHNNICKYNC